VARVTGYKVVTGLTKDELESNVNEFLKHGYQPLGALVIHQTTLAQAMVMLNGDDLYARALETIGKELSLLRMSGSRAGTGIR